MKRKGTFRMIIIGLVILLALGIQAQSLQVDTISGGAIISKVYLMSMENALLQAEKR